MGRARLKALLLSAGTSDLQFQRHLAAGYKCRPSGLTLGFLNQKSHFDKVLRKFTRYLRYSDLNTQPGTWVGGWTSETQGFSTIPPRLGVTVYTKVWGTCAHTKRDFLQRKTSIFFFYINGLFERILKHSEL